MKKLIFLLLGVFLIIFISGCSQTIQKQKLAYDSFEILETTWEPQALVDWNFLCKKYENQTHPALNWYITTKADADLSCYSSFNEFMIENGTNSYKYLFELDANKNNKIEICCNDEPNREGEICNTINLPSKCS